MTEHEHIALKAAHRNAKTLVKRLAEGEDVELQKKAQGLLEECEKALAANKSDAVQAG